MSVLVSKVELKLFRNYTEQCFIPGRRITLISGQNGVGKSTLLSLIASGSGSSKKGSLKNKFQPDFSEFFRIDENEEYMNYSIFLTYLNTDSNETTEKRLSFKNDSKANRGIRVIPRTSNSHNKFSNLQVADAFSREHFHSGGSARIPLPTIYLSVSRLQPIGEHHNQMKIDDLNRRNTVYSSSGNEMFSKWYNEVIPNTVNKEGELHLVNKGVSPRNLLYMDMLNIPFCSQSVGQDNLGNIISALVDIYLLSLEDNYQGSIICIDEIDVSLHPYTQLRLLNLMKRLAGELKIQFFLSTHSLTMIEEIFKWQKKDKTNYSLIYFKDPSLPRVIDNQSFGLLKADMMNSISYLRPKIKIYFEDEVGELVFRLLIQAYKDLFDDNGGEEDRKRIEYIKAKNYISIERLCSIVDRLDHKIMNIGCRDLLKMPEKDDYFKRVLFCLDGDARVTTVYNVKNYLKHTLPTVPDQQQVKHSPNVMFLPSVLAPESFMYFVVYKLASHPGEFYPFWKALDTNPDLQLYTSSNIYNRLCEGVNDYSNDEIKEIFDENVHRSILWNFAEKSHVLSYYFRDINNMPMLIRFINSLVSGYTMCSSIIGEDLIY